MSKTAGWCNTQQFCKDLSSTLIHRHLFSFTLIFSCSSRKLTKAFVKLPWIPLHYLWTPFSLVHLGFSAACIAKSMILSHVLCYQAMHRLSFCSEIGEETWHLLSLITTIDLLHLCVSLLGWFVRWLNVISWLLWTHRFTENLTIYTIWCNLSVLLSIWWMDG